MSLTVEVLTAPPYANAMPRIGGFSGTPATLSDINTVDATYLIVALTSIGTSSAPRTPNSITSPGLTFTLIGSSTSAYGLNSAGASTVQFWGAPLSAPLTGATITGTTVEGYGFFETSVVVFGVIGAIGIDSGLGTLPALSNNVATPPNQANVSTTNAGTMLLYAGGAYMSSSAAYPDTGVPTSWTEVQSLQQGGGGGSGLTVGSYVPGTVQTGLVVDGPIESVSYEANTSMLVIGLLPNTVSVPDIVGLSESAAESLLASFDLTVGTTSSEVDPSAPGTVLTQNPPAGTIVGGGTSVDFTYSAGVEVPNVVNTSAVVVAPGILAAAGFVVGAVSYAPSGIIIAGNIISQFPAAGAFAAGGSGVNIVVSSGLPTLTIPDLFGLTQADAIALLLSLGLGVGAIGSAPSQFVPVGEVQQQNPTAGAPCAGGTIVSFVISLGQPATSTMFDFEATVISQYANSPTILQLCQNLNQYIDQSANFANFYNFVWNVDSAVGFGLDIWGKIVNVSRLLRIPNSTIYAGFYLSSESQPDQDWTPAGSDQPPYNNPPVGGAMYTGSNATNAYLLPDDSYRQLILAKAFANICTTTAPAINQILQNLYGPGTAFVLQTGPMAISYNLTFAPTAIQQAILEQSGIIPTPPGVAVVINTDV